MKTSKCAYRSKYILAIGATFFLFEVTGCTTKEPKFNETRPIVEREMPRYLGPNREMRVSEYAKGLMAQNPNLTREDALKGAEKRIPRSAEAFPTPPPEDPKGKVAREKLRRDLDKLESGRNR